MEVLALKSLVAILTERVRTIFGRIFSRPVGATPVPISVGTSRLPEDLRSDPRQQPLISVPIYDKNEPGNCGIVLDVSQNGLRVMGLRTQVGDRKTLILDAGCILGQAGSTANQYDCRFQAECRWVRVDGKGDPVAGFRIKVISLRSLDVMRELVRSISPATS